MELENLGLKDLQTKYAEVVGAPTRCPNRVFLIRRIREGAGAAAFGGLQPTEHYLEPADPTDEPFVPRQRISDGCVIFSADLVDAPASEPDQESDVTPRSKLPIEELQRLYMDTVGRPTGSTDRRYLLWKIREVERGRIAPGPRQTQPRAERAGDDRIMVLPLRLTATETARLDEAWKAAGAASRTAFLKGLIERELGGN